MQTIETDKCVGKGCWNVATHERLMYREPDGKGGWNVVVHLVCSGCAGPMDKQIGE